MKYTLILLVLLVAGCQEHSVFNHVANTYIYDSNENLIEHIRVTASKPLSMNIKRAKGEVTAIEFDSKKPSALSDITKLWAIKWLEDNDD